MKKIAVLLALALMLAVACAAVAEGVSIAIVYSDTVDDKGWCQAMDTGIKNAIEKGYEIEYTPVESVAVSDAPNTLDQLADSYDIIIVHGAQFTAACTEIAEQYPEQIFAIGTSDQILGDNIFTYMPQSEEPGYINGIIAGLLTKANKVGIVGPTDGAARRESRRAIRACDLCDLRAKAAGSRLSDNAGRSTLRSPPKRSGAAAAPNNSVFGLAFFPVLL